MMNRMFFLIIALGFSCLMNAQVGINTTVPYYKSVFHIDGKKNNTSSTTVTAAQAIDDVVIDTRGCVGIGTVEPTAKLHINSVGSSVPPIRISDGSEGAGKYLFSDADGRASWSDSQESNGVAYYTTKPMVFPINQYTAVPVEINEPGYSQITIPRAGNYIVVFRWWGNVNTTVSDIVAAAIRLEKVVGAGSALLDETQYYVSSGMLGMRPCFIVSLFAPNLGAGDRLVVKLKPLTNQTWELGSGLAASQQNNRIYYPSIIVYNI